MHCCVPMCQSDSRYDKHQKLSFHNIPIADDTRQRWIANIRRDEGPPFKITNCTHVCSLHFAPDAFKKTLTGIRRLNVGAVPTLFSRTQTKKLRRPPKKRPPNKRAYRDISASECSTIKDADAAKRHTPAPTRDHDYSDPPSCLDDQLAALKRSLIR